MSSTTRVRDLARRDDGLGLDIAVDDLDVVATRELEATQRHGVAEGLVLALGVVGHDPLVERHLGLFDGVKDVLGEELVAHRAVQSFDLAGRGRMVGRGEAVLDAVVEADPVKEHGGGLGVVLASEDATIVRQDLLGWAVTLEGEEERVTDRAGGRALDQVGTHAVTAVVIDAGHAADRRAVREIDPSDHVHLPHLHRTGALEALVVLNPAPARRRAR